VTPQGSLFGDEPPREAPDAAGRTARRRAAAHLYATFHAELSAAVVGQPAAVARMALVGVYHVHGAHGQRPLLWGGPGVGKSTLARALADSLGAPYSVVSVPDLVETGYHGTQIGDVLGPVFAQDPEGERGPPVVILEGFDTLCTDEPLPPFGGVEAQGRHGVQRSLLGLFEGTPVSAPVPAAAGQPAVWRPVHTAGVLVIGTGAFPGVPFDRGDMGTLVRHGIVPALAARIGPVIPLGPHTPASLATVLERALRDRRRLAEACGLLLRIDPGLLRVLAQRRAPGGGAPPLAQALAVLTALVDRGMERALFAGTAEVHVTPDDLDWGASR